MPDRSPVDLVVTADEQWLLTANQTAHTVSLVQLATGKVVAEVACGRRPSALALTPDGTQVLVSGTASGDLTILSLIAGRLHRSAVIPLGFEPRGVAVSPDGRWAYVALTTGGRVAVIDLQQRQQVQSIPVCRWPRYLALSPDGRRLAVGVSGDLGVAVVDTDTRQRRYLEDSVGLNLGHMQVSADGRHVYVCWLRSRSMPTTADNIRRGWVLGSRLGRVRLDEHTRREGLALDPLGDALCDPHGLALSPDGRWLALTASGTHELVLLKTEGLPYEDFGDLGDHIRPELLNDGGRFIRIPLGGRPMAVRFSRDGRRLFVANYLANSVQVVDRATRKVVRTIDLGGPAQPSPARRGEAIFYDGDRCLDHWFSCHSCHYEGHTNAVAIDNRSDGREGFPRTVLSLRNVTRTGPWRWNGWQSDLDAVLRKSLVDTLQGPEPTRADLQALTAFLDSLQSPPSPYREADGSLSEAAQRGRQVFQDERVGCSRCHSGPLFTDRRVHDVGLSEPGDRYKGFKTPSLRGAHDRTLYLHDGRAVSLEDLLQGPHSPDRIGQRRRLSEADLRDLIAYLRSL